MPFGFPLESAFSFAGILSDEARTLRWFQVDFGECAEIRVGASKTQQGKGRRIPVGAKLKAVLAQHAGWHGSKLGAVQPDWFVFPLSNRLAPSKPTKPVTSLKTAWESVREVAHVTCRLHDLRHTFCTKLAEAGVPEGTMLDMMGDVSTVMLSVLS